MMKLHLSLIHQFKCRLTVAATILIFSASSSIAVQVDPLTVSTEAGQVRGTVKTSAGATAEVFLGVPFAAPPVGALRWMPPTMPVAWDGVRDASKMPPLCPQGKPDNIKGDEDCLYLNIFRPSGVLTSKQHPVMVYAYGGGNTAGGAANFDGTRLAADNNMIVVVLNYRLGALGFLNHPALGSLEEGGNFGVMDTKAALQWVQKNIAAFGGNPKRVTLASQSSGATNVCRLLVDADSANLFHAVTLSSEDCIHDVDSPEEAGIRAANLAKDIGCADAVDVAACLRSKTFEEIVVAGGKGPQGRGWNPTAAKSAAELIAAGQWNKVPVLMGIMREEGRSAGVPFVNYTVVEYENWVRRLVGDDRAADVLALYPASKYSGEFAIPYVIGDIVNDSGMRGLGGCPNIDLAKSLAEQTSVYYYRFEDPSPPPRATKPIGYKFLANHGYEVRYLWNQGVATTPPYTEEQISLANEMIRYWGAFVRNHNPEVAGQRLWPRLDENGKILALRPGKESAESNFTLLEKEYHCNFWRTLPVIMERGEI